MPGLLFAFLLMMLLLSPSLAAQEPTGIDTVDIDSVGVDTVGVDSLSVTAGESGLQETVSYSADSVILSIDGKKAYLYQNAVVTQGEDKLQAAYIEFDLQTKEVYAEARYDSVNGKYVGVPLLNYSGEELSALTMKYNFETGRGVSSAAEIAIEDAFIHVDRFKRVSENTIFGENLQFTTCDAPHPHFYFKASKAKLVTDDKIYADKLLLYIKDVPVIALPVSVFFALGGGRHSGIIIPSFRQSTIRGVEINGLGYFWAINDYLDTRLTTDITTKGFFNLDNRTRFRSRALRIEQSDLSLTYGRSRNGVEDPFETSWTAEYGHQQKFLKETRFSGRLEYATQDAFRKTTNELELAAQPEDITTQNIESNFTFTSVAAPFGIRLPYSLDYSRTQDIVTREINPERYVAAVNPQPWTPFARSGPEFLSTLSFGLQPRYTRQFVRRDTVAGGGFRTVTTQQGINLAPSFSLRPKLGYFTISPTIGTNSSIFFRRIVKQANASGGIDTNYINGFYTPFWWSVGATARTTLYAIVQPRIFGLNAIRHRMEPEIGFSLSPDFSDPSYGYFDQFFNPLTNRVEPYSIFEADRGTAPFPTAGESRSLRWSLDNSFEAKIDQGDTLDDRKITLLNLNLRGSYNFADTLFPFSTITAFASTNLGKVGSFSANATFDPYRQDSTGARISSRYAFPWVRVTTASLTFSTSFSNEGFNDERFLTRRGDSVEARRERFVERGYTFDRDEFYGSRVRGNNTYRMKWNIDLGGTYTISPQADGEIRKSFNIGPTFFFALTPTTTITTSGSYDLIEGRFNIPSITLEKDLHDWEMSIRWQQTNTQGSGIFLSIGFTPSMLRDLRQEFTF